MNLLKPQAPPIPRYPKDIGRGGPAAPRRNWSDRIKGMFKYWWMNVVCFSPPFSFSCLTTISFLCFSQILKYLPPTIPFWIASLVSLPKYFYPRYAIICLWLSTANEPSQVPGRMRNIDLLWPLSTLVVMLSSWRIPRISIQIFLTFPRLVQVPAFYMFSYCLIHR